MDALGAFLNGQSGLFDHLLAYQRTPNFERDLRRYWKRHRDMLRENEEERAAFHREWRRVNRDKARASDARYYARECSLPRSFTDIDWQRCLDYFDHRCAVCGRPAGLWHKIARAHWIPLNRAECPGTVPANIIPLCNGRDGCNQAQKDKDPVDWLIQTLGKRKAQPIIGRILSYLNSFKVLNGEFGAMTAKAA